MLDVLVAPVIAPDFELVTIGTDIDTEDRELSHVVILLLRGLWLRPPARSVHEESGRVLPPNSGAPGRSRCSEYCWLKLTTDGFLGRELYRIVTNRTPTT